MKVTRFEIMGTCRICAQYRCALFFFWLLGGGGVDLVLFARYAVVTGANRGIGIAICNGLAFHGITVVLTARDEKRDSMLFTSTKGQVNNAAVLGNIHDHDVRRAALHRKLELELTGKLYAMRHMKCQWNAWKQIGPKRMVEAFLPLLQSSQSPSIVNASSLVGKLETS
nr:(+)-neomenthol dehydrogenase-like isoform X5 [Coffea arabica]